MGKRKKVRQRRTDGCTGVAPGLVFNFRWKSLPLSDGERKSVKSTFIAASEEIKWENCGVWNRSKKKKAWTVKQIHYERKCGNRGWQEANFTPVLYSHSVLLGHLVLSVLITLSLYCLGPVCPASSAAVKLTETIISQTSSNSTLKEAILHCSYFK